MLELREYYLEIFCHFLLFFFFFLEKLMLQRVEYQMKIVAEHTFWFHISGKELQRVKALNVLGKSMKTSYGPSAQQQTPQS